MAKNQQVTVCIDGRVFVGNPVTGRYTEVEEKK